MSELADKIRYRFVTRRVKRMRNERGRIFPSTASMEAWLNKAERGRRRPTMGGRSRRSQ